MPGFLKQNTGVLLTCGPFVDAADGFTAETAILLSTASLAAIRKMGSLSTQTISMRTLSHAGFGIYTLSLAASDLDTVGLLSISIVAPNIARPWADTFNVVPANTFDALVGGSDKLDVNVSEIDGNAAAGFVSGTDRLSADVEAIVGGTTEALNLKAGAAGIVRGTVDTSAGTPSATNVPTNLTESTNDHYNSRRIVWLTGALAGQANDITDYNGASKNLTITAATEAAANGDTFEIV